MISVIIPNYKNKKLLFDNLERNLNYLTGCQVIIINDNPSESLRNDLQKYEDIVLIENETNLGFGESINRGVKKAKGELLFLLNNDVQLINDNYKTVPPLFQTDQKLFAVTFAQEEKDGQIVGKNIIYWKNGFFRHSKGSDLKSGENGWAEAGACIIDRKKFIELGGFDKIYSPFYWEDIDLSSRARRQGYKIMFDPQIKVIHHHESTIGKYFAKDKIRQIAFRNQLIFNWRNIKGLGKMFEHLLYLVPTIAKGGLPFFKGFVQALYLTL